MAYTAEYNVSVFQKILVDGLAAIGINVKENAPLIGLGLGLALVAGTMVFAVKKFKQVR